MKELITQNLGHLRGITGRSDLIDPITAEIISLERQIDEARHLAQQQENNIGQLVDTIQLLRTDNEALKSRPLWQRIINKVL